MLSLDVGRQRDPDYAMPEIIATERPAEPNVNDRDVRVAVAIAYALSIVMVGIAIDSVLEGEPSWRVRWGFPIMAACGAFLARRMSKRRSSGAALLLLLLSLVLLASFGVHVATVGSAVLFGGIYGRAYYVLHESSND